MTFNALSSNQGVLLQGLAVWLFDVIIAQRPRAISLWLKNNIINGNALQNVTKNADVVAHIR